MIIESRAPLRIDLSGGTLDIWPLYLFHPGSMTINMAIDLYARVRLKVRSDKKLVIKSSHPSKEIEAAELSALKEVPGFELFKEVISFFSPPMGLQITSHSEVPAGSGLGGSSALMIALLGAFNCLVGDKYKAEELILLGKNLEARVTKLPTGEQDFYSALYGGINCLHLGIDKIRREGLMIDTGELEKRLILCYSGISRFSGLNNWNLIKRHLDGDKEIFDLFDKLRDISKSMRSTLISRDYPKIGKLFTQEWQTRRRLPGKISSRMELLKRRAEEEGALAAKVCGAGGGGCLLFWTEPENNAKVINCLENAGAQVMKFQMSTSGLVVNQILE